MKTGETDESLPGQGYIFTTTEVIRKQGRVEFKPVTISPLTLWFLVRVSHWLNLIRSPLQARTSFLGPKQVKVYNRLERETERPQQIPREDRSCLCAQAWHRQTPPEMDFWFPLIISKYLSCYSKLFCSLLSGRKQPYTEMTQRVWSEPTVTDSKPIQSIGKQTWRTELAEDLT